MKHVNTGTLGGTGRLRTHLRKCNKEFARLDDIEKANRNRILIPENSMGVGGSNMVQNNASNNLKAIDYLKCRFCSIDNDSFHIKCAAHVYNLIVKDELQNLKIVIKNVDLHIEKFQKKYALDEILYLKCLKLLIFIKSRYN
ncbi:hypothetical protein H5410_037299 [Solanum commersonii]|uniref:Uncharacterized protein n=1 Tax=Solanum commersonii TaxID=4109 RepID=A0A9J5Y5V9_SOLCO|nr:hypothetical protein H5410_037299 [Solanum commersonii]